LPGYIVDVFVEQEKSGVALKLFSRLVVSFFLARSV
jgi:hypothetical protein